MATRVGRVVAPLMVAIIGAGLLWPVAWSWLERVSTPTADDPVSIARYSATYDVRADGLLVATELITAEFPAGRHGIFRYWDVADPADPSVRYIPTVASITRDGRPEPYSQSWAYGYRYLVATIGATDVTLVPGPHTYELTYVIPGAISPAAAAATARFVTSAGQDVGAPASAFLWSVVAPGWEMPIAQAEVTVRLPHESGRVQCATDPWGTPGPCEVTGSGTDKIRATAAALPAETGMVLRAAMQPDAPPRGSLPWSTRWDPVLGRSPGVTVALLLLALAAGLTGALVARGARERAPDFPVVHEPPAGLGPVQVAYLDTEDPGPAPLVASVLHLAERGVVRLERLGADTWQITNTGAPAQWAQIDPVTRTVAEHLGLWGSTSFAADGSAAAGKALRRAQDAVGPALATWSRESGLMVRSTRELVLKILWFVVVAVAILMFWLPAILDLADSLAVVPTLAGLVPAALALTSGDLLAPEVGQRHTERGRVAWSQAGGFRRMLSSPAAEERFDSSARNGAFIAFIPYAVALGVADGWADKYRIQTGAEPPVPPWYGMPVADSGSTFYSGGGFGSFTAAVAGSIAAYAAVQAAARGAGSGGAGGFGGGGGGGGGSW